MATCEEVSERVAELLEGKLPAGQRLALWVHFKMCPPCAAYYAQIALTVKTLGQIPPEEPPEPLKAEVLAAFRARNPPRT